MRSTAKLPIQSIVTTGIFMIVLLFVNTSIYAVAPINNTWTKTKSEKIAKQVDKIKNYLELLKNADDKKALAIQKRIDMRQEKIHNLLDASKSSSTENSRQAIHLPFTVYDFDIADNSLILDDFTAGRSGSTNSFYLNFKTELSNEVKVDIVSPGGELIQSIVKPKFRGSFDEEVALSSAKGKIYFVHVNLNGKSTTKKVVFK